jgi:hypothetical protein
MEIISRTISIVIIQKKREYHLYCGDTRIFIVKRKNIQNQIFWTFKSCLSYVPSFKYKSLKEGFKASLDRLAKFLDRFIANDFPWEIRKIKGEN